MSHGCWRLIHPCDNITSLAADTFTSLWEMKAVFEDMLCPLFKCPLASRRRERKKRLGSEGMQWKKSVLSLIIRARGRFRLRLAGNGLKLQGFVVVRKFDR